MEPLSVFYIIKNEEKRLPESLEKAVQIADEIIVLDSGSTDRSVEIAESFGAKVFFKKWEGYAIQKAHAASLCKNEWLLNLDADEILSNEVIQSIKETLNKSDLDQFGGFEMQWKYLPPVKGHPLKYIPNQYLLRLYNKNKAGFKAEANSIEDRASVNQGKLRRLRGVVYHKCILSFDQLEKKYSLMSSDQAKYFHDKKRKISNLRFYLEFPLKFFKYFFIKGLCRNGWYGFSVSIVAAYRNFMRLAKTREIQMNDELEKKSNFDPN